MDEYRELDGERVLVLISRGGCGKTSDGPSPGSWKGLAGKVIKFVAYFVRDRALSDLGLAPEAGSRARRPRRKTGLE